MIINLDENNVVTINDGVHVAIVDGPNGGELRFYFIKNSSTNEVGLFMTVNAPEGTLINKEDPDTGRTFLVYSDDVRILFRNGERVLWTPVRLLQVPDEKAYSFQNAFFRLQTFEEAEEEAEQTAKQQTDEKIFEQFTSSGIFELEPIEDEYYVDIYIDNVENVNDNEKRITLKAYQDKRLRKIESRYSFPPNQTFTFIKDNEVRIGTINGKDLFCKMTEVNGFETLNYRLQDCTDIKTADISSHENVTFEFD
jgi:hypothetical protein